MSNNSYTIEHTIENLSEEMTFKNMQSAWEDIQDAWEDIVGAIEIFRTACENHLEKLGYDENEYEEGSSKRIDAVLELLNNTEELADDLSF